MLFNILKYYIIKTIIHQGSVDHEYKDIENYRNNIVNED